MALEVQGITIIVKAQAYSVSHFAISSFVSWLSVLPLRMEARGQLTPKRLQGRGPGLLCHFLKLTQTNFLKHPLHHFCPSSLSSFARATVTKDHPPGGWKPHTFIVSGSWRLGIQGQGVGEVDSF